MGIVQENRFDAPQPDVKNTEYGATYVKAATENPIDEAPAEKKEEEAHSDAPAVEAESVEAPAAATMKKAAPVKNAVKKTGRPRKK